MLDREPVRGAGGRCVFVYMFRIKSGQVACTTYPECCIGVSVVTSQDIIPIYYRVGERGEIFCHDHAHIKTHPLF